MGRDLVKQVRREPLEKGRMLLEGVVRNAAGRKVVSLHTDISTVSGERVIVFTLEGSPIAPPADGWHGGNPCIGGRNRLR